MDRQSMADVSSAESGAHCNAATLAGIKSGIAVLSALTASKSSASCVASA